MAAISWVGAFGGSILRSITTDGTSEDGPAHQTFVFHVPEGEKPWYASLDGKEVQAEEFPLGETAKVYILGKKAILLRLEEDKMVDRTGTDQGCVAFASTCTHLGCQVYFVQGDTPVGPYADGIIYCPCHQGAFDPFRGARVIYGPPPQALPRIPLRVVEGRLEAV